MNILIAGDFYISDNFKNQPLIDQSVEKLFASADFRIINLETPLTGNIPKNRIVKTGPHLRSSAETLLPYLQQLKVDIVTLANNHIMDYGIKGLSDTLDTLRKSNIYYVGAGNNLHATKSPYTIEAEGMKIAILNFCENEWSIAEEDKPGANPLDIIENIHQIKTIKAAHDKVICIIHGGHEYYHLPSPRMVKQYRFYIENGVDAIVGHHTHCIGGYEIYKNAPIIYSLGNFLFTLSSKQDVWYQGLLARLKIKNDEPITFDLFPLGQEKKTFRVSLFENGQKQAIMSQIKKINVEISGKDMLQEKWDEFVNKRSIQYINSFSPISAIGNRYIRGGLHRFGISKLLLSKNYLKVVLNLARCEAHADCTKAVIKKRLDDEWLDENSNS